MTTLLRNVRIFDGHRLIDSDALRVHDGRIVAVGSGLVPRTGETVVEGGGGTVIPGLIDAHTHVFPGSLEQALAFGVTTEIDMFAEPAFAAQCRLSASTRTDHADVRSAGTGATVAGGHPTQLVERGVYPPFPTVGDDPAAFVADRVAEGSDHLKIFIDDGGVVGHPCPTLPASAVAALVAAAHDHGLLAVVHPGGHKDVDIALDAGADGLAHLPVDRPITPSLADRIAAAGTFVIATLGVGDALCGRGSGPALAARYADHLDATSRQMLTLFDGGFPLGQGAHPDATATRHSLRMLHDRRVPLLAGTDAGTLGVAHGVSLHHELALMVGAGLAPSEALTAATAAPAAAFGLTDRGRIEPGLLADLVLVAGDPTVDITATTAITGVWRRGARWRGERTGV